MKRIATATFVGTKLHILLLISDFWIQIWNSGTTFRTQLCPDWFVLSLHFSSCLLLLTFGENKCVFVYWIFQIWHGEIPEIPSGKFWNFRLNLRASKVVCENIQYLDFFQSTFNCVSPAQKLHLKPLSKSTKDAVQNLSCFGVHIRAFVWGCRNSSFLQLNNCQKSVVTLKKLGKSDILKIWKHGKRC